jgi:hypothetical protein
LLNLFDLGLPELLEGSQFEEAQRRFGGRKWRKLPACEFDKLAKIFTSTFAEALCSLN